MLDSSQDGSHGRPTRKCDDKWTDEKSTDDKWTRTERIPGRRHPAALGTIPRPGGVRREEVAQPLIGCWHPTVGHRPVNPSGYLVQRLFFYRDRRPDAEANGLPLHLEGRKGGQQVREDVGGHGR